jgi:hypothetical protein
MNCRALLLLFNLFVEPFLPEETFFFLYLVCYDSWRQLMRRKNRANNAGRNLSMLIALDGGREDTRDSRNSKRYQKKAGGSENMKNISFPPHDGSCVDLQPDTSALSVQISGMRLFGCSTRSITPDTDQRPLSFDPPPSLEFKTLRTIDNCILIFIRSNNIPTRT